MSKTATHTPGPWKIGIPADRDTQRIVAGISGCTIEVARTGIYGNGSPEADAKLIASAPDLAEALRDLLRRDTANQLTLQDREAKARAALKRAGVE